MLDWHKEEDEYVYEKVNDYQRNLSTFQRVITGEKQMNKNLDYIIQNAKLKYREEKLNSYLEIVINERKKIDRLVDEMNYKFEEYLNKQATKISKNIKHFKKEAKPYNDYNLEQLETVKIYCEPFEIAFLQEKVGGKK